MPESEHDPAEAKTAPGAKRVLVVDDDPETVAGLAATTAIRSTWWARRRKRWSASR
jgi:hypothetical protein